MNFKRASELLTEVSREWGISALRFQQVHDRKISPEECAREFTERQEKIAKYLSEFREGLKEG